MENSNTYCCCCHCRCRHLLREIRICEKSSRSYSESDLAADTRQMGEVRELVGEIMFVRRIFVCCLLSIVYERKWSMRKGKGGVGGIVYVVVLRCVLRGYVLLLEGYMYVAVFLFF